jgi:hypothetical protein
MTVGYARVSTDGQTLDAQQSAQCSAIAVRKSNGVLVPVMCIPWTTHHSKMETGDARNKLYDDFARNWARAMQGVAGCEPLRHD